MYDTDDERANNAIKTEHDNNYQNRNDITNNLDNDLSKHGSTVRFSNYDDNILLPKPDYDNCSTYVPVNTDTTQFDKLFERSKTAVDNEFLSYSPPHPRCYSSTSPPKTAFKIQQHYYPSHPHLSQQQCIHSHIIVPTIHANRRYYCNYCHQYYYENNDAEDEKIEKAEEIDEDEENKQKKNKLFYSTGIYNMPSTMQSNNTSFFSPFTDSNTTSQQNYNTHRQSIGLKALSHHIPTDVIAQSSSPPTQQTFSSTAVATVESARTRRKKYSLTHTTLLQSNNQNETPLVRSCSYKRPQSIKKYRQKRSNEQQTSSPRQLLHSQLEKKNSVGNSTANKNRKLSTVTTHNNYSLQKTRKSISAGTTRISAIDLMATDDPADQWSSPKSPRSSRVGSLPLDQLQLPDEEIYRIRQFNTTSKGFVNRGDSFKRSFKRSGSISRRGSFRQTNDDAATVVNGFENGHHSTSQERLSVSQTNMMTVSGSSVHGLTNNTMLGDNYINESTHSLNNTNTNNMNIINSAANDLLPLVYVTNEDQTPVVETIE
ncbi:unnamed protein product, partial [Didymodactylos carnosus]